LRVELDEDGISDVRGCDVVFLHVSVDFIDFSVVSGLKEAIEEGVEEDFVDLMDFFVSDFHKQIVSFLDSLTST